MGVNMGYNSHHHKDETEVVAFHTHVHTGSLHLNSTITASNYQHKETPGKNDCCNKNAIQFQHADKNISHTYNLIVKVPVFVAFLSAYYGFKIKNDRLVAVQKSIVPQFYPPPDIRIAIQSFQI